MDYSDKLKILAKQEYSGQKPGLQRMRRVLQQLHNPQHQFKAIHVAGTNGKGSTSVFIQSILMTAGFKVGLYTSPHFIDCRERVRVNKHLISKRVFNKLLPEVFATKGAEALTYFEVITAVAFKYFADCGVDFVVCEVGLGGRFDATNILKNKLVNVITSIDFDHAEFLGDTLVKIAHEKAGIITSDIPAVVNTGHRHTDKIISAQCAALRSPVFFLNKNFNSKALLIDWQNQRQQFDYYGINNNYPHLTLRMLGSHQIKNASLAVACVELLTAKYNYKIATAAIYKGLDVAYWPGRLEIIDWQQADIKRTLIIDGAHNVAGVKTLVATLQSSPYPPAEVVLLLSILSDKNYRQMCQQLSFIANKVIIFSAHLTRALPGQVLAQEWYKYLPKNKVIIVENFTQACQLLENTDKIVCVSGSLYAVSEAIKYVQSTTYLG